MLKRLRWMVIGAVFAAGLYVWVSGRVRSSSADQAAREAGRALRDLGVRLREAFREGLDEVSRRDAELRREFLDV